MSQKRILDFLGDKKVLVLCGGNSSERLPSLLTGQRIFECLINSGLKAELLDLNLNYDEFVDKAKKAGLVFLGLHGGHGEDGTIQGLLDFWHIPYTGSGVLGSSIGMNKLITKKILKSEQLPTADFVAFQENSSVNEFVKKTELILGYPMMLKIWDEGSGNGVFYIKDEKELRKTLVEMGDLRKVFAEKYIKGRELSVGILEINQEITVLPILESLFEDDYFSLKVRSDAKKYRQDIEAVLDESTKKQVEDVCRRAHLVLGASAYSRIDIKLDENTNTPFVLEITTLPGLTENSWFPKMAAMAKIDFGELVNMIILGSLEKYDK